MHLRARLVSTVAAALTAIPLTVLGPAAASQATSQAPATAKAAHSCATAKPGFAACKALVRTDLVSAKSLAPDATPSGFGPAALQSAYNLPSSTAGSGRTVAIVDAYDDPTAEAD